MRRLVWLAVLSAVGVIVGSAVLLPPRADAACVTASVWVDRYHTTPTYVVGPDQCVIWTPWTTAGGTGDDVQAEDPNMVPGQPNGVGYWITIPSPVLVP